MKTTSAACKTQQGSIVEGVADDRDVGLCERDSGGGRGRNGGRRVNGGGGEGAERGHGEEKIGSKERYIIFTVNTLRGSFSTLDIFFLSSLFIDKSSEGERRPWVRGKRRREKKKHNEGNAEKS